MSGLEGIYNVKMNIYPALYKIRDIGRACTRSISNRTQLFNYDAFHRPITCIKDDNKNIRLNLLVMSIEKEAMFGGITTAIKIFKACCDNIGWGGGRSTNYNAAYSTKL